MLTLAGVSASARPFVITGMALAIPPLPVLVPTPPPVHLTHASSVNLAVPSPLADPNVTYWLEPLNVRAPEPTGAASVTVGPESSPSLGVTATVTVSPVSPFPATETSNTSVVDVVACVRTVAPLTFQTYVSDTTSAASRSVFVAVAVSVPSVPTGFGDSDTVAVGAVLPTVTASAVTGPLVRAPSDAVTRTAMLSPLSPFPAGARLSVDVVAPAMSTPFFVHW